MAVILGSGCLAVFLGQDANWDTRNYHVYNPYALLAGRLDLDLAPAQLQSYFSPLIDLPVYWLNLHLPPWFVGFLLGSFHGFNAVLVFLIARTVFVAGGNPAMFGPMLLAVLGCLNASFIAQLGTSAGDSSSSPLVLSGLYLLCHWCVKLREQKVIVQPPAGSIGLLMGLAIGLKLTNAPFAVAMAITLALIPAAATAARLRNLLLYIGGVLFSFMASSGWWFYEVWAKFGNPLFPQFNGHFRSELATATSVIDTRWGPVNLIETLAWPVWMGLRPARIHDAPIYNYLWVATFAVLLTWLADGIWNLWRHRARARGSVFVWLAPEMITTWLLIFSGLSYVVWLKIFSIGRYMTAIEVMLPLFVYLGFRAFIAHRMALAITLLVSLWSLSGGVVHSNFGLRAAWSDQAYKVDLPAMESPSTATVLIAADGSPNSWLLSQFPPAVAVYRVSGNFPRTAAYDKLVRAKTAARAGKVYVIAQALQDFNSMRLVQLNHELGFYSFAREPVICAAIGRATAKMSRYKAFSIDTDLSGACRARLINDAATSQESNADYLVLANQELIAFGYQLATESCRTYSAFIGQMDFPYQFCEAKKMKLNNE
ncbi:MAG: hypothetical protein PHQ58_13810 [Rhodoferax sp.]|uniref:hypothetical protein n=1 Tax=Rhodoferax sp. TaxID=50421 RepID=UPI0026048570|nr:hypothetical protein [Rhodoferax sp.]MDD2881501.1 hypothetical protein [Rhodoferax sp.]